MDSGERLELAKQYVARGDEFYAKAADEIVAAMQADSTLSYRQVAEFIGKGPTWVGDIVRWRTSGRDAVTPFSDRSDLRSAQAAKKVLREATPEQLEEIVSSLPDEQKAHLAKAATPASGGGSGYRAPSPIEKSLVSKMESFSLEVNDLEDRIAGTWHDDAPLADEEQIRLAANTVGEFVQKFGGLIDKVSRAVQSATSVQV